VKSNEVIAKTPKQDIKALTLDELKKVLRSWGEPQFRADQIFHWMHAHSLNDFSAMLNLSKSLRQQLDQHFFFSSIHEISKSSSAKNLKELTTQKFLFQLHDGLNIESVLIPSPNEERNTVCVSSQVGCSLGCRFCATGKMGFSRNLTAGEIVGQVHYIQNWLTEHFGKQVTNVVFMGMGEPLMNLERCLEAIRIFSHQEYQYKIPERKITLSTIGLIPGIETLVEKRVKFKLAISLHSGDQNLRNSLVPAAVDHPLTELKSVIKRYNKVNRYPVTLEYLLLKDVNDNEVAAQSLKRFADGLSCKINLIDFNFVEGIQYLKTDDSTKQKFIRSLLSQHLRVTARKSRGQDKNAACGQLASKVGKTHSISTY